MHKRSIPFRVLFARIIAVVLILFLMIIGIEYAYWMWKGMSATIKAPAIVLTEDAYIKANGKECHLPRGLVLYPLNELECCPEVYDEKEYKIYIGKESLKFRKLTESEILGKTNLIYRLEIGCEHE